MWRLQMCVNTEEDCEVKQTQTADRSWLALPLCWPWVAEAINLQMIISNFTFHIQMCFKIKSIFNKPYFHWTSSVGGGNWTELQEQLKKGLQNSFFYTLWLLQQNKAFYTQLPHAYYHLQTIDWCRHTHKKVSNKFPCTKH